MTTVSSFELQLLKLRLTIGMLGEKTRHAWWPTSFFESSSKTFVEPVFCRTWRLAQYRGVQEAASRLHDEHLNVGVFHLFRLPEETEQDLHGLMLCGALAEEGALIIESAESAMTWLRTAAADRRVSIDGPKAVGSIDDLEKEEVLRTVAQTYYSAFLSGTRAYPYLLA